MPASGGIFFESFSKNVSVLFKNQFREIHILLRLNHFYIHLLFRISEQGLDFGKGITLAPGEVLFALLVKIHICMAKLYATINKSSAVHTCSVQDDQILAAKLSEFCSCTEHAPSSHGSYVLTRLHVQHSHRAAEQGFPCNYSFLAGCCGARERVCPVL